MRKNLGHRGSEKGKTQKEWGEETECGPHALLGLSVS
jgi:hypothetical protein